MEIRNPKKWYKLDNAAKIFPGQSSKTWSNIFRVSAVTDALIDADVLTEALVSTLRRFPCYKVKLKNGLFWHYLVENPCDAPKVMQDVNNPCYSVKLFGNDGFPVRVYCYENRVSVELYHILSDGHGGCVFLFTLLGEYYRLLGESIPTGKFVLDINQPMSESEASDAFIANATSKATYKRTDKYVYHPSGTKLEPHRINIISGTLSFSELHKITASKGVTVTEYIAAVLLAIHIEKQRREERKQKEICIQIPIDLRRHFNSDTLRNFTICLRVKIDPMRGDYTFDELLKQVLYQLRMTIDKNYLNMMITANTKLERNKVLKFVPLIIKDFGIKISFAITGEQTTTALLSNLGYVELPDELLRHIEKCIFMPGPGLRNPARVGVDTVGDSLTVTFASFHKECDIQREFFTFFVKQGLNVKIESNRQEGNK